MISTVISNQFVSAPKERPIKRGDVCCELPVEDDLRWVVRSVAGQFCSGDQEPGPATLLQGEPGDQLCNIYIYQPVWSLSLSLSYKLEETSLSGQSN